MINHNKNIPNQEFENKMRVARGLSTNDNKEIIKERRRLRISNWEDRLLDSYKNLIIPEKLLKKIISNKNKGIPIRLFIFDSYNNSFERKKKAFQIAKSLIWLGYSNKNVEFLDLGLLFDNQMEWSDKSDFYKKINNSNLKLLILTDFRLQKTNVKSTDLEMFWSRIFTLLSNNPKLDLIITSSDSNIKFNLSNNETSLRINDVANSENFLKNKLKELMNIYNFKELINPNIKINDNSLLGKEDEAIKSLELIKGFNKK